jgi:hypothetical protein
MVIRKKKINNLIKFFFESDDKIATIMAGKSNVKFCSEHSEKSSENSMMLTIKEKKRPS